MSSPRRGLSSVEEKGSQALGMVFQLLSQVPPCVVLKRTPPASCTFPRVDSINAPDVLPPPSVSQSLLLEPTPCSALGPG